MTTWTKLAIISKVESDLDLQEETIITDSEMSGYLNEAISDCEALIHTIYEDYFLTKVSLPLVLGQSLYTIPANIYASKIRGIVYRNGPISFKIKRIHPMDEFEEVSDLDYLPDSNPEYKYLLVNNTNTDGVQIELHPPSQETSLTNVTVWYLREATQLSADADVCDIPEFINYIFAHMKKSCMAKETLGVAPPEAVAALEKQEQKLINTLTNRTPDNDNEIPADLSHYEEHT